VRVAEFVGVAGRGRSGFDAPEMPEDLSLRENFASGACIALQKSPSILNSESRGITLNASQMYNI